MSLFNLRYTEQEDVSRLEELEAELFPDNCLNQLSLLREIRCGKCLVAVRADTNEIVAYVLVRVTDGLADILRIGVSTTYQGHGLGTQLMEAAIRLEPKAMLTVRKTNVRALALYKRLGFRIIGELTHGIAPGWAMQLHRA